MVNHPRRSRRKAAAPTSTSLRAEDDIGVAEFDPAMEWASFLSTMQDTFNAVVAGNPILFCTDVDSDALYATYLDNLPGDRQVHTCTCCRHFLKTYGGLVTIAKDGRMTPAMWGHAPPFYARSADAMSALVHRARVTSPFLSPEKVWGTPITNHGWTHFAVRSPLALWHRVGALTPDQVMAAKREDYGTVIRALADFTPYMLDEALRMLNADTLSRSERFIGPVQWMRRLHETRMIVAVSGNVHENVVWRAVAEAPAGFCHIRTSVVGPLLEGIADGVPFATLKARFDAMLHPLRYQRPQAAPSIGNIAAAEKLVEKLGIARSLERRFARLDECETMWTPRPPAAVPSVGTGVFGHLKPSGAGNSASVDIPRQTVTWEKFVRTVLPTAESMMFMVPAHGNFIALTAAVHANAPPILKWDREDRRNSIAWYVYHNGSDASQWRLRSSTWCRVNAVVAPPSHWGDRPMTELASGAMLLLDGAVDTRTGQSNALFPETLKAELHGVRATIEAYSKSARMQGVVDASACGYHFNKGAIGRTLRIVSKGAIVEYTIDRWD